MSLEDQEDQARHLSTMTHKEAIHGSERIFSAKYTDTTDALESDRTRNIARHTAAPSILSSHLTQKLQGHVPYMGDEADLDRFKTRLLWRPLSQKVQRAGCITSEF
jgi:hypothetical protein